MSKVTLVRRKASDKGVHVHVTKAATAKQIRDSLGVTQSHVRAAKKALVHAGFFNKALTNAQ